MLQPLRIFQVVYIVMILALGATAGEWMLRSKPWRLTVVFVLLGLLMAIVQVRIFPNSTHLELPWSVPGMDGNVAFFGLKHTLLKMPSSLWTQTTSLHPGKIRRTLEQSLSVVCCLTTLKMVALRPLHLISHRLGFMDKPFSATWQRTQMLNAMQASVQPR